MRTLLVAAVVLAGLPLAAIDPKFGVSTITVGAGGAFPAGGELTGSYHAGPSFAGEYELGLHRFLAATIGVENYFLNVDQCSRFGCPATRERFALMPFGLRGVLPLAGGRGELFAGTGGARLWTADSLFGGPFQRDTILWHLNAGLRFALDRGGHFRLGPTVRLNRDLGRPTQEWMSLTAEFSYRFGG
jgi:hypothetical protein